MILDHAPLDIEAEPPGRANSKRGFAARCPAIVSLALACGLSGCGNLSIKDVTSAPAATPIAEEAPKPKAAAKAPRRTSAPARQEASAAPAPVAPAVAAAPARQDAQPVVRVEAPVVAAETPAAVLAPTGPSPVYPAAPPSALAPPTAPAMADAIRPGLPPETASTPQLAAIDSDCTCSDIFCSRPLIGCGASLGAIEPRAAEASMSTDLFASRVTVEEGFGAPKPQGLTPGPPTGPANPQQ